MQSSLTKKILIVFFSLFILAILLISTIELHKVGRITYCTHGEILKDNTRTAVAFSLNRLPDEIVKITDTCAKHKKFDELYKKALAAFSAGNAIDGSKYLSDLKKIDKNFSPRDLLGKANDALNNQVSANLPAPVTLPPSTNVVKPPVANPTPAKPFVVAKPTPFEGEDLSVYLPSSLPGYRKLSSDLSEGTAWINFAANDKTKILSVITTAHKYANEQQGRNFVKKVNMVAYPKNRRSATYRETTAYYGTNGSNYASLAWSTKNFAFEILMVSSNTATTQLMRDALYVANYFPKRS